MREMLHIFCVITWSFYFCNAQTFSTLTPSSAVRAIGSDVEITTTVTTTSDFTATWRIGTTPVAAAAVLVGTGATNSAVTSGTSYTSRLAVSVGSYTSNQFTTTLTIQGLLATDNGATVDVGSGVSFVTSLQLNVQESGCDVTGVVSVRAWFKHRSDQWKVVVA
ncbi:unnamed protein product [Clavelina lepadiformis]|uniref:Uncharacterized protein n=1 Tax=Clavelina lepadiformis TaxID=159417 RepID=A0ABP0FFW4_CLALP